MAEVCSTPQHLSRSQSNFEHLVSVVEVIIDGEEYAVSNGSTVLEGCEELGIKVPFLCHHPRLKPAGRCNVCVVEAKYKGKEPTDVCSCSVKMQDGLVVKTGADQRVRQLQAGAYSSVLRARRERQIQSDACVGSSHLDDLSEWAQDSMKDTSTKSLVIDQSKCVQCSRCVRACRDIAGQNVFSMPINAVNSSAPLQLQENLLLDDTACINCGQCSVVCPSGAIVEKSDIGMMFDRIADPDYITVVTTAPAVRVALGEPFGEEPGSIQTEAMVGALRALGFNYVFDTLFTADLTIMEEGTEFLGRVQKKLAGDADVVFPMFTSCCPGWINMVEKHFPELRPNLSTCKSPQQMMGALIKTYFCQIKKLDPKKVFHVSVMPCTAKKYECSREEMGRDGYMDVDLVLTTRELARAIKQKGLAWNKIVPSKADDPLGESTSAADLFGVSGGVMEAALRTAMHLLGSPLPNKLMKMTACRGLKGVKEAIVPVPVGDKTVDLKICIVNGGANAKRLCEKVISGEVFYHFIEIMACPSGCIGGGGQPQSNDKNVFQKRMKGVYKIDEMSRIRQSHENKSVATLYEKFLGKPNGHKSHELLHTGYKDRMRPKAEVKEMAPAHANSLLVLYGSQTGRAQHIAEGMAQKLKNVFDVRCVCMNDYPVDSLNTEVTVLAVVSTFRDGDFPDNALAFWDQLSLKTDEDWLARTRFCVFGLCSKNYPLYNAAGLNLDSKFEALGGIRITGLGAGDDVQPGGLSQEDQFEGWFPADQMGVSLTKTIRPKFSLSVAFSSPDPLPPPDGYEWGVVVEERTMTPPGYKRVVKHMGIKLPVGLSYRLGDALSVWPMNDEAPILSFLGLMKLNPFAVVRIDSSFQHSLPKTTSVLHLFRKHLDVFKAVSPNALAQFALFASDEKEAERLYFLSSEAGAEEFKKWAQGEIIGHRAAAIKGYNSIFEDFPSVRPSLDYLIQLIPDIVPRQYSISSTPSTSPEVAELTFIIPTWVRRGGSSRIHSGLCTNYLEGLKVGDRLSVSVHDGIIQLAPETKPTGIICVGLGTGVAPMRAIVTEMIYRFKNKLQEKIPMHIYIGCRHEKEELLYLDLWKEAEEWGCKFLPAFSHDQEKMILVNDKMNENYESLVEILKQGRSFYYYCGPSAWNLPATMIQSFRDALLRTGMTMKKVDHILFDAKVENRFHVEAFST